MSKPSIHYSFPLFVNSVNATKTDALLYEPQLQVSSSHPPLTRIHYLNVSSKSPADARGLPASRAGGGRPRTKYPCVHVYPQSRLIDNRTIGSFCLRRLTPASRGWRYLLPVLEWRGKLLVISKVNSMGFYRSGFDLRNADQLINYGICSYP